MIGFRKMLCYITFYPNGRILVHFHDRRLIVPLDLTGLIISFILKAMEEKPYKNAEKHKKTQCLIFIPPVCSASEQREK